MAILLTGSTGKIGREVVKLFQKEQTSLLLASRNTKPTTPSAQLKQAHRISFDFTDPTTFDIPFQHEQARPVSIILLLVPSVPNGQVSVNAFVDHAKTRYGVDKFVLMAASNAVKNSDTDAWGKVWQHLEDVGAEYAVIGPNWFMGGWSYLMHVLLVLTVVPPV